MGAEYDSLRYIVDRFIETSESSINVQKETLTKLVEIKTLIELADRDRSKSDELLKKFNDVMVRVDDCMHDDRHKERIETIERTTGDIVKLLGSMTESIETTGARLGSVAQSFSELSIRFASLSDVVDAVKKLSLAISIAMPVVLGIVEIIRFILRD